MEDKDIEKLNEILDRLGEIADKMCKDNGIEIEEKEDDR